MSRIKTSTVDEYIATHPAAVQDVLHRIRAIVRKVLPNAEESISYGIPGYKLHGRPVIYFAGWKAHYSLYPANERLVKAFQAELEGYEVSKGTIRFPFSEPMPAKLIEGIVRFKAEEAAEAVSARNRKKTDKAPARRKAG